MSRFSGFIRKQGQLLIDNHYFALFNTVVLVILPYTGWLAATIIALVTLREGKKAGAMLLIPALIVDFIVLKTTISTDGAIIGCFLSYIPCYLAAIVLRVTTSWRAVSCAFFLMVLLAMCLLQALSPEFITQQYVYLREILHQLQLEKSFSALSKNVNSTEQSIFANYLVGIQAACVVASTLISLVFARYIQSRIYYPEGFKREMRLLRANKVDLLLLILTLVAVKQNYLLAINMLPLILFFFFMTGLSLWFNCMAIQRMFVPMLILSVVLGFYPHVMLPVYVLVGVLDTLVNFRLYLTNRAGKAIREVK